MTALATNTTGPLALKQKEAAKALSISLMKFRQEVMPELRVIRLGATKLYPVADLVDWIERNAAYLPGTNTHG